MGRYLIALIQDPLLKSPEMTGEWEGKLKKIERSQLAPDIFMAGISDYIRTLIEHSSARRIDPARWGSCPLCGKEIIKGKRAYGCSGWKEGCPFVLEAEYKGITLTPRQIQALLQLCNLPQPVGIDDEPRILILSTQGLIMDLRLPSADRQKDIAKEDRPAKPSVRKNE